MGMDCVNMDEESTDVENVAPVIVNIIVVKIVVAYAMNSEKYVFMGTVIPM